MNPFPADDVAADFVDGLIAEAYMSGVKTVDTLREPFDEWDAGTYHGERLRAQIAWFQSLDAGGQAMLEEVIKDAVRTALFEACVFLDSGSSSLQAPEGHRNQYVLSLETRTDDDEETEQLVHSQPVTHQGPDLHDEFMAVLVERDPAWKQALAEEFARSQKPENQALSRQMLEAIREQMTAPQSEEEFAAKMRKLAEEMHQARIDDWKAQE
ncbi:MAG TPA: hypothetical protein VF681_06320 [Abditibacteriaceae bacterium]|jgi:hypothetical protein